MIHFLKSGSRPRKAPQAVLGLSWEGRRIEGTLLRRTPAGLQKVAEFQAELSVELDSGDPETIGKELRARLDEAGILERACAVALSVSSLLVTQTEIPPLADADAHSLLQLEAEKGFHADASSLQVAYSRCPGRRQPLGDAGRPAPSPIGLARTLDARGSPAPGQCLLRHR